MALQPIQPSVRWEYARLLAQQSQAETTLQARFENIIARCTKSGVASDIKARVWAAISPAPLQTLCETVANHYHDKVLAALDDQQVKLLFETEKQSQSGTLAKNLARRGMDFVVSETHEIQTAWEKLQSRITFLMPEMMSALEAKRVELMDPLYKAVVSKMQQEKVTLSL